MSIKYLLHQGKCFAFNPDSSRLYMMADGCWTEIDDLAIRAMVRLKARELSPRQAMTCNRYPFAPGTPEMTGRP